MRIVYFGLTVLCLSGFLAACVSDHYTMANGQPIGDKDKYWDDLHSCRQDAMMRSYEGTSTECQYFGIPVCTRTPNSSFDVSKAVQACMMQKGYAGTSSDYN